MNTKQVQESLINLGWPLTADGSYGPVTQQAVFDFQRGWAFYHLLVDGKAGPQTWNALRDSLNRGGACGLHFKFREFKSRGNGWIKVHRDLVYALDRYRERYGPTPIISGYRDILYNRKVGGASNSQHVYGAGVDIPEVATVPGVKNLRLFSGIGWDTDSGKVRHVDVRASDVNTTNASVDNPTIWTY